MCCKIICHLIINLKNLLKSCITMITLQKNKPCYDKEMKMLKAYQFIIRNINMNEKQKQVTGCTVNQDHPVKFFCFSNNALVSQEMFPAKYFICKDYLYNHRFYISRQKSCLPYNSVDYRMQIKSWNQESRRLCCVK